MNKSSIIKISSMAIGAVGAAAGIYNIGTDGTRIGRKNTKDDLGEQYLNMYTKTLSSTHKSSLLEKIKNYMTFRRIDSPTGDFFTATKNYTGSFASSIMHNMDTLLCATVAIGAPFLMKRRAAKAAAGAVSKGVNAVTGKVSFLNNLKNKIKLPSGDNAGVLASAIAAGYLLFDGARIFIGDVLGVGKEGI